MPDDALRQLLISAAAADTKGPERLEALKAAATCLAQEERIKFDVDGAPMHVRRAAEISGSAGGRPRGPHGWEGRRRALALCG